MFNNFFGEEQGLPAQAGKRVSQWTFIALVFLSLFLLAQALIGFKKLPSAGNEVYPQSTISVSGNAEVYVAPDIATFTFSTEETGTTVEQAQEKSDDKIATALASVREAGIEDKDIKTTGYNVYPKYEYSNSVCLATSSYCPPGKQTLVGYTVSQSITVKVRDTAKAGDLVTKVGAAGVSNISGIQFTVDDRDKYVAQAREEAIAEAKVKAKELAKQLGIRLGKIMYYSENGAYPMYAEGKGGATMDIAVSSIAPRAAEIPVGENKITSDITITYEIK